MQKLLGTLLLSAAAVVLFVSPGLAVAEPAFDADADRTEAALLAEINFARTQPQAYAERLMAEPVSAWEAALRAGGDTADAGAYDEAVAFLLRQSPLPPLSAGRRLRASSSEHVATQGADGQVGHQGPGGERFDERLRRHGVSGETVAEDIAYGPQRPADVVRELIIDRGVASRGHRRIIFETALDEAGAACGPHPGYGAVCVIDFASRPLDAPGWRQAAAAPSAPSPGRAGSLFGGFFPRDHGR